MNHAVAARQIAAAAGRIPDRFRKFFYFSGL